MRVGFNRGKNIWNLDLAKFQKSDPLLKNRGYSLYKILVLLLKKDGSGGGF